MREVIVDTFRDPIAPDILQVLQLHTAGSPWLPGLREFACEEATEAFVPFIPLFLYPKTTAIDIRFVENIPSAVVASMIARLSTLCPDLECIGLDGLPRHPVITETVSETLLACNQDTLQTFRVDSPLTEEAREAVYRLPRLLHL